MKKFFIALMCIFISNYHLLSQNISEIFSLYENAVYNWESSSKLAKPYFEKLYYQIEPLYNRYYTNNLSIGDEIHKISRNYIRFMNDYYIKGFGGKEYIENAWKMSQTLKGYEALKEYNALMLLDPKNEELLNVINNTDIYDYEELRKLNKYIDIQSKQTLFLEIPTIQEIQNKLQNDDLYISFNFSLNDRSFYIILISPQNVDVYKSKITTYELYNRIAIVKGIMNDENNLINIGCINLSAKGLDGTNTLDKNLSILEAEINQAIKKFSAKNIIIENDIIISQIPFDLLHSNNVPFYKKYNITYVPNASYYIKLHNTTSSNSSQDIVGISPEINEDDIIMEQEINILKDLNNASVLTNCSRDEFLSFINENHSLDILHISSHFNKEVLTRDIEKIEIDGKNYYYLDKLSKEEGCFAFGDNDVSIQDILTHNHSTAKTLVLSGCETATSDDVLSIINPIWNWEKDQDDKVSDDGNGMEINLLLSLITNQGCYCNSTKSFDNLFFKIMWIKNPLGDFSMSFTLIILIFKILSKLFSTQKEV